MEEKENKNIEIITGLLVAFFGAVLAISGIGGDKYGGDQSIAASEATKAYAWYQSKSIKKTSLDAQKELLITLLAAGAIQKNYTAGIDTFIQKLEQKSSRYQKEMREILEGSDKVGKENWIQDKNGKLGEIIGATEWEERTAYLDKVGDWFDLTNLFLNLCLVLGAISLVIDNQKVKKLFMVCMIVLGIIGSALCIYSFYLGYNAPYS